MRRTASAAASLGRRVAVAEGVETGCVMTTSSASQSAKPSGSARYARFRFSAPESLFFASLALRLTSFSRMPWRHAAFWPLASCSYVAGMTA